VAANVITLLQVALKPGTANLGSVTTPAGWTPVVSHIGGGYGATLASQTGNTRVYLFSKVDNTNAGSLAVTLVPNGANGVAAAAMQRIEKMSGTWQPVVTSVGEATLNAETGLYTPTPPMLASRGDFLIYAFALADTYAGSTALSAGTGFAGASPSLALGPQSTLGFGVKLIGTARRAQRGLYLPDPQSLAAPVGLGNIVRGPMVIARYRVR
jgi:hypothetical protein